jgi:hypothetical protein
MRKLTITDITDIRAYERERETFRAEIIAMKKRRRIQLGELMTIIFENTQTMRFQIQEMARVEKLFTDEQIQHEVETYNDLIPEVGELRATLFIELTNDDLLREWLPKLPGIQRHIAFVLADGSSAPAVEQDEARLTREAEMTTTVHYLTFSFTPAQVAAFDQPGTKIVVDHPEYPATVELSEAQRTELAGDLA